MNEQMTLFETNTLISELSSIFLEITSQYGYPENTFSLKNNYSKKGKNAGKLISTSLEINEMSYPYDINNKIARSTLVLYITANVSINELKITKEIFSHVSLPATATILKEPSRSDIYFHIAFDLSDHSIYQYIKSVLMYSIENYNSASSFGCCSKYAECSSLNKCTHSNKLYAKGCFYRKNLESGNNFFYTEEGMIMSKERINKGDNIILFPDQYTVIDIETTGLSPDYDDIIELSAVRVRNGSIVDKFTSLVKPPYEISDFITDLTGITNEMLSTAPTINSILADYLSFLGSDILIGHNVNFDINFIYDNSENVLGAPFKNSFVDTMRIFRKLHPELKHHRLKELAAYYKIDYSKAHRSLVDCEITQCCYEKLLSDIKKTYENPDAFINLFKRKVHKLRASDIMVNVDSIDEDNPIYGKTFVFTGTLEKMVRKDAMQIVVNHGGSIGDSVTAKTNYLVLGNNDYCPTIKDGKSSKHKKAEALKAKGNDIDIITENVFYDMIFE